MSSSSSPLHGDGLSDSLFHHLWQRDELSFSPPINLPDTIVYKFGQPVCWYFTGTDGRVKRKMKQNIVNLRIEEAMLKNVSGSDIVAYYICEATAGDEDGAGADKRASSSGATASVATKDKNPHDVGGGSSSSSASPTIEYFDRSGLHDFLYSRWKDSSGVLQKFVEPKGTCNSVLRAIWSPKVCLLERRVNGRSLHDRRYGLYERAITYEGPEFYSQAAPLRGNVLPSQVQRVCEMIVEHVGEVSFMKHRIRRMVLNFKVDSKDRLWLLWSSSIRLDPDTFAAGGGTGRRSHMNAPINIDSIIRLPPTVKLSHTATHTSSATHAAAAASSGKHPGAAAAAQSVSFVSCISCARQSPSNQFHPVPYKTIIAHFESLISLLTTTSQLFGGGLGGGGDDGRKNGPLEWPPPPAIITAAGGVGFGTVKTSPSDSVRAQALTIEDVTIPPVIRSLHMKLGAIPYRRYKKDPLFLYKTALCCERCFLVFAEMAAGGFNVVPKGGQQGSRTSPSRAAERYHNDGDDAGGGGHGRTSADRWAPVSMTDADGQGSPARRAQGGGQRAAAWAQTSTSEGSNSSNNNKAFQSQAPPNFPTAIRNGNMAGGGGGGSMTQGGLYDGGGARPASGFERTAPPLTEEIIQKREDAFFKEMLTQGASAVKAMNPLTHLITAQSKLASLDNMGVDGVATNPNSKKKGAAAAELNPYQQPQKLVEVVKKRDKKVKKSSTTAKKEASAEDLAEAEADAPISSASAARHRDFLLSTLNDIQRQLAAPTALRTLVERQTQKEKKNETFFQGATGHGKAGGSAAGAAKGRARTNMQNGSPNMSRGGGGGSRRATRTRREEEEWDSRTARNGLPPSTATTGRISPARTSRIPRARTKALRRAPAPAKAPACSRRR